MVRKTEYDFLTWTSFPSSLKLTNDEKDVVIGAWTPNLPIAKGDKLRVEVDVKQKDVPPEPAPHVGKAFIWHRVWDGKEWAIWAWVPFSEREIPSTPEWTKFSLYNVIVPEGFSAISFAPHLWGSGVPNTPGIAWFDNLKIYKNDVLIYSDDFNNWNPYIGAGAGGAAGALAGYLITRNPVYALAGIPTALIGAAVGIYTAKP